MSAQPESVRVDKWLWAVRLYKSRTLASEACAAGHVKIDGNSVKPSREIRPGEELTAKTGRLTRTVKMIAVLDKRVAGKAVPGYLEDLTPPEEYERAKIVNAGAGPTFPKGSGRPTKKQRRLLKSFTDPE
ncbi:MAG: ribosome-associated heat shock protein Hsp15 [Limisphaerales bacterium]